ncbi:protein FAM110A-like [Camelus ferus]|uniref:Protein FAM110A-like n=1 Tax=Camelus ferus TaxID=419612 RepID=A0A8B8U9T6_CAMFR|nr:protein FAM110A-like [Camelus ferus]
MLAAAPTRRPPTRARAAGRPPPLRPPHPRPPDISTRARSPLWPMNNARPAGEGASRRPRRAPPAPGASGPARPPPPRTLRDPLQELRTQEKGFGFKPGLNTIALVP